MDKLQPMLMTTLKGYTKKQLLKDVISGIIVSIIALPLSIALALASGVGPEEGIYTAIIAGFIISLLGGSPVQIAGPTAAFATIVAGIVAENGMDGLAIAALMAGLILVIMGFLRLGSLIKFIPFTITTGFTAGIAVTIAIGQLKDFCGVVYPAQMPTVETVDKLSAFIGGISTVSWEAILVGVVCLIILVLTQKFLPRIPGSLLAVIAGILMVRLLPLQVNTIGDLYTVSSSLPSFHLPDINFQGVKSALPNAVTIAFLAAIESLLSCVVADGMIDSRHRPSMELIAQGAGNIASALFGGIPATGAIARTAANIKNGGRTPVSGIVHAVMLLLILVLLMPYAGMIPMPTIAAILMMVAYNMCQGRVFLRVIKTSPRSDAAVMVLTFALTVVFDLVVAIAVGMILACLLFMKRMSNETSVRSWVTPKESDDRDLRNLPKGISVYEVVGPLFFGSAEQISNIQVTNEVKCIILRMRSVPGMDTTAINALTDLIAECEKYQTKLILSHVNKQPYEVLQRAGLLDMIEETNICRNIEEAIARAVELLPTAVKAN